MVASAQLKSVVVSERDMQSVSSIQLESRIASRKETAINFGNTVCQIYLKDAIFSLFS